MRCLPITLLLLFLASACGGGSDAKLPDANLSLPMCTGVVFDACTSNTQCMSMSCKLFSGDGIQVCTQACSTANPCPMQNGAATTCNNMGICKPAAANACHP